MVNKKVIYSREQEVLVRRIREARLSAGLTQGELAKRLGKHSHSSIVKLEQGQVRVEFLELRRLCQALDLSFPGFVQEIEEELERETSPDKSSASEPQSEAQGLH